MPALPRRCEEVTVSESIHGTQRLAIGESIMASGTLTKPNRLKLHRGSKKPDLRTVAKEEVQPWTADAELPATSTTHGCASSSIIRPAAKRSEAKKRPRRVTRRLSPLEATATTEQLKRAEMYRQHQLGRMPLDLHGWDLHGKLSGDVPAIAHGGMFDWSLQENGRVSLAAASALGTGLATALASASLLAALRAHGGYPHTSEDMLARLNHDLWRGSAGDQYANAWYAILDPANGRLEYSLAGSAHMFLYRGQTTSRIDAIGSPALGVDTESPFFEQQIWLDRGDTLLIVADDTEHGLATSVLEGINDSSHPIPRMTARALIETVDGVLGSASPERRSLLAIRHGGP